jgi:hypothetical protein
MMTKKGFQKVWICGARSQTMTGGTYIATERAHPPLKIEAAGGSYTWREDE